MEERRGCVDEGWKLWEERESCWERMKEREWREGGEKV